METKYGRLAFNGSSIYRGCGAGVVSYDLLAPVFLYLLSSSFLILIMILNTRL